MANKHVSLQSVSPEYSLYHYTKCTGVQGILKEPAFRATKSDFLNDTNEMLYILSIVQEILKEFRKTELRKLLQEYFFQTIYELKKRPYYILSFSTDPDSITLWAKFGENNAIMIYALFFKQEEFAAEKEYLKHLKYDVDVYLSKIKLRY
ncbi:MAG: hypothetical protein Q4B75_00640 [Eubacteriales bacterium]|nr:hypothetical protein [Eubacteriales bacterium]